MPNLRSSEIHPVSGLQAVVEDDDHSAWLYLRDAAAGATRADCWLYNRRPFDRAALDSWPRDQPPPVPSDLVGPEATSRTSLVDAMTFVWSRDGHSVAIAIEGTPIGYIAAGERRGFSRHLRDSGPWGAPFDGRQYAQLFGEPAG